jgi:hypothetical protein
MDPKAALDRITDAISTALDARMDAQSDELEEALIEARDAASDLGNWLSSGNFAPKFNADTAEAFCDLAGLCLELVRGEL